MNVNYFKRYKSEMIIDNNLIMPNITVPFHLHKLKQTSKAPSIASQS